jgi:hypothetical protein
MQYFARESGRADLGGGDVINGFDRTGAYKAVRGHTTAVQSMADTIGQDFQARMAAGDEVGAIEAASRIAAMRNALGPDVSEENKAIITSMLQGIGVDIGDPRTVDEQLGAMISPLSPYNGSLAPAARAAEVSSHIRNRAGLYEQGDPARRGGWTGTPGGNGGP